MLLSVFRTLYSYSVSLGEIEFSANVAAGFICVLCLFSLLDEWKGGFSVSQAKLIFTFSTCNSIRCFTSL